MENAGWKVIKIHGDSRLNSNKLTFEELNFAGAIKTFFGNIGLPDFLCIKNNAVGFVEVKYKGNLTNKQIEKINFLKSFLSIWCYIAKRRGNIEIK